LVEAINEIRETWRGKDMQPPEMVAGVELVAKTIEMLDLNREDRIHDRQLFTLKGKSWQSKTMIP
ncbi:MAG: hypothetical protein HUJ31_12440, partial [Pseudomonadales bacterium]|nr:hypothetical protein [Pseudomonadales bacterium]